MLKFVRSAFRGFVSFFLWINLILWTIVGGIVGNRMGANFFEALMADGGSEGHPIIGAIIGFIIGLLINIFAGGFIATILNIDENLEQLRNNANNGSSKGTTERVLNKPLWEK